MDEPVSEDAHDEDAGEDVPLADGGDSPPETADPPLDPGDSDLANAWWALCAWQPRDAAGHSEGATA